MSPITSLCFTQRSRQHHPLLEVFHDFNDVQRISQALSTTEGLHCETIVILEKRRSSRDRSDPQSKQHKLPEAGRFVTARFALQQCMMMVCMLCYCYVWLSCQPDCISLGSRALGLSRSRFSENLGMYLVFCPETRSKGVDGGGGSLISYETGNAIVQGKAQKAIEAALDVA